MHQYKLLKEIREKAFDSYYKDPLNEEARSLFLETNKLYLTTERDEEDDENQDFSGEDDESQGLGFDIFGIQDEFDNLSLDSIDPIDPSFGLKAALCFDSVNNWEATMLKSIQEMTPKEAEIAPVMAGPYEKYIKDRVGRAYKKYRDVVQDVENARMNPSMQTGSTTPPRTEFTFSDALKDEFGNMTPSDLPQEQRSKLLSKRRGNNLGLYISKNGDTISKVGAGQLEFLARMVYMASGGQHPGIASEIKTTEGVSREDIQKQEEAMFRLAPSTVGYNCLKTLRDYLSHAVKKAIEPIVQKGNIDDFIQQGLDKVVYGDPEAVARKKEELEAEANDAVENIEKAEEEGVKASLGGIAGGKYTFEMANLARWSFQVIKNRAVDLLRKHETDYLFDETKAVNWIQTKSFPLTVYSKAKPERAKELKAEGVLRFFDVDTGKTFNIKGENDKFYKYTYANESDFLNDLRISNGDVDSVEVTGRDGERKRVKVSSEEMKLVGPLHYSKISLEQRKYFMTSMPKTRFLDTQDFPEVSTAEIPEFTPEEREDKAREIVESKKLQDYLDNIVNDMYNKIVSNPASQNKYGQKNISAYMKSNEFLTKKLIKAFLNFGVYTFQKDHYQFITKPQNYYQEFFDDMYKSEFPRTSVPSTIKSGDKEMPMYQPRVKGVSGSIQSFLPELRRVILGSGPYSYESVPLLMKGDKESDEEFTKRLMTDPKSGEMAKSAGFLIQNPDYIRNIYKVLSQMSADAVVGRRKPKPVDESAKNIKSLISEVKKGLEAYKNQITKNFIKSWN